MDFVNSSLIFFVGRNNAEQVRKLLDLGADVNYTDEFGNTPLVMSVERGTEVTRLLLAHPDINVNLPSNGRTALMEASLTDKPEITRLLLDDPRVDIVARDAHERSALWHAALTGRIQVMKWFIASDRNIEFWGQTGRHYGNSHTLLGIAREFNEQEMVVLLERYRHDPDRLRYEIRVELGVIDKMASTVFASIVFLCDGLLKLIPAKTKATLSRFLAMAQRLPLELQMKLCYVVYDSRKTYIATKHSEPAFKAMAKALSLE